MTNDELFSEEIHEIATALAAAQGEFPAIPRSREVLVRPKDASKSPYKFWYATLDGILTAVRPVLSKHGLALTQMVVEKRLRTILMHSSGQYIGHDMPLTYYEVPQQYGSELTYKRRYGVATLLCIAADDDDDGNAASGNEIVSSQKRPPVKMPEKKANQPDHLNPEELKRFKDKIQSMHKEVGDVIYEAALKHLGFTETQILQTVGREESSKFVIDLKKSIDAVTKPKGGQS